MKVKYTRTIFRPNAHGRKKGMTTRVTCYRGKRKVACNAIPREVMRVLERGRKRRR